MPYCRSSPSKCSRAALRSPFDGIIIAHKECGKVLSFIYLVSQ
nr:MAG TPA: HlyD family secretion protein [Caudoviricetes sp.]DAV98142.1 MAG TPA: HlyD family secretion protein [Caudoviricetes sp.]